MRKRILFLLLAVCAVLIFGVPTLAQEATTQSVANLPVRSSKPTWHRAIRSECIAEEVKEQKVQHELGIQGDPPISLGAALGTTSEYWSENPCGYADDSKPQNFRTRYVHFYNHKEQEITKEQYEKGIGAFRP